MGQKLIKSEIESQIFIIRGVSTPFFKQFKSTHYLI